jgi:hypothetical protein
MRQEHGVSWDALVAKRMSSHFRQFHAAEEAPGRRTFLRSMAALGLSSGLWLQGPVRAAPSQDGGDDANALPKPIPGGVSPFGILVHHFPLPAPGTPLNSLTEPSEITDFNGFIGDTRIRGAGIGTGFATPLAFQTDVGFMKGEYVGEDGRLHHGTFCFI